MDDHIAELELTLDQINTMIAATRNSARAQGIDPMMMQSTNGTFMMTPLIIAKQQAIVCLIESYRWREKEELRKRRNEQNNEALDRFRRIGERAQEIFNGADEVNLEPT